VRASTRADGWSTSTTATEPSDPFDTLMKLCTVVPTTRRTSEPCTISVISCCISGCGVPTSDLFNENRTWLRADQRVTPRIEPRACTDRQTRSASFAYCEPSIGLVRSLPVRLPVRSCASSRAPTTTLSSAVF
jgi:hypothetical protein